MNTENELFGELHEQEENGLFGNEHRRQYEAQQEALRQPAVIKSVCKHCGKAKSEHTTASGMCKDKFKFFEQTDL